jgi:quinoprotein glucose dehydrogenase
MGMDPASSVVDPWGRSHDHPNLWVVGAPTLPPAGCNNGTLTFCALALRSAARMAEGLPVRRAAGEARDGVLAP